MDNTTTVSEFLLLEFSGIRELQVLHFFVFLVLYLAIVTGNLFVIFAVAFDCHLHTPMYFFIMNLAMQDLGQISVIIPKSMMNALMNVRHISYSGCMAQVLLLIFFLGSDFFLLTLMAYDRYVAICYPLQYEMVMNRQACFQMIVIVWCSSFLYAAMHTSGTFAAPFCSNVVNQFFCEIPQLLKVTCSNLYFLEIGVLGLSVVIASGCFAFIIVTYTHIFNAVFQIPSVQKRKKVFSTCLPHLIVLSTYIFAGCIAYLRPMSNSPSYLNLICAVIYSIVPPLVNPVIYSLRNKEIKVAVTEILFLKY
ncbi:olfactory receptor 14I1-like [Eublepharis macularius]|uniref:Olfactory receptor n=1 Tax=Eublepharis macularius TaxID=481883 RepID=A0AA97KAA7_EUBMA|nr:olfactory receptor 14I1-like [Eublepharis macularius]